MHGTRGQHKELFQPCCTCALFDTSEDAFAITLTVGVCILFVGFLVASNATNRRAIPRAASYVAAATAD